MCAASERSAREPESQPPIASATMTPAVIASDAPRRRRLAPGVVAAHAVRVRAVVVLVGRVPAVRVLLVPARRVVLGVPMPVRSVTVGVAVRHSA